MNPSDVLVPLRKQLAEFIHTVSFEKIPADAIQQAKHCLLDLVGVAIAGSRQNVASVARSLIPVIDGGGDVTLWGDGRKLSLLTAVLLNAIQGHAIDMDDGHRYANGHPGVMTIPTAVALSESSGRSGKHLLEAIVVGYEVFIRLGTACNPDLLQRGFHTTATVGAFASAAVASKLLGLSVTQTANALSLAGLQSAGLLEALSSGESGKSLQVGRAAQGGVLAALLAQRGADGPELILEGAKGFGKAFAGKDVDAGAVCRELGARYKIQDIYFKRHAACRHIHSAIDALSALLSENTIKVDEIEAIDIDTYSIAKNLTGHLTTEKSELAAKFSMPVTIGLRLVFGRTDAAAFCEEHIADPQVQKIARLVAITSNPAWDALYPGKRGADVRVRTPKATYRKEVVYPKGEPEFPLSIEELVAKFDANAGMVYSGDRVASIRERIMGAEKGQVSDITSLLQESDVPVR